MSYYYNSYCYTQTCSAGCCAYNGYCPSSFYPNNYCYEYYSTYYYSTGSTGVIAGAVVGAVVFIAFLIWIGCYCYRKRQADRVLQANMAIALNPQNTQGQGGNFSNNDMAINQAVGQGFQHQAIGQPVYGQPAYGQPAYGQPAYGQQNYGANYGGNQPVIYQ